jgi:hypothetical protein
MWRRQRDSAFILGSWDCLKAATKQENMEDDRWFAGEVSVPKRHAVENRIPPLEQPSWLRPIGGFPPPEILNRVRQRITMLSRIC